MTCKWCRRKSKTDECRYCRKRISERVQRELGKFIAHEFCRNFYMGRNT